MAVWTKPLPRDTHNLFFSPVVWCRVSSPRAGGEESAVGILFFRGIGY